MSRSGSATGLVRAGDVKNEIDRLNLAAGFGGAEPWLKLVAARAAKVKVAPGPSLSSGYRSGATLDCCSPAAALARPALLAVDLASSFA
jgi:hypothetical protein